MKEIDMPDWDNEPEPPEDDFVIGEEDDEDF